MHRLAHASLAAFPLALALALSGCVGTASPALEAAQATEPQPEKPHWSYAGEHGPMHWADLNPDWQACAVGSRQSPIDIPIELSTTDDVPALDSAPEDASVVDTGHTLQLAVDDAESIISWRGTDFAFTQMHYHTPSEHLVGGVAFDAEFHFVHESDEGKLLVLGVLAEEGDATPAWSPVIDSITSGTGELKDFDIHSLVPISSSFATYSGSLTTPPCSQDVEWIVLETPVTLSSHQLESLESAFGENARPVADLNERVVEEGSLELLLD